jgi:hypothetical protein
MMTMSCVLAYGLNFLVDCFNVKTCDIWEVHVTTRREKFKWKRLFPRVLGYFGRLIFFTKLYPQEHWVLKSSGFIALHVRRLGLKKIDEVGPNWAGLHCV